MTEKNWRNTLDIWIGRTREAQTEIRRLQADNDLFRAGLAEALEMIVVTDAVRWTPDYIRLKKLSESS